MLHLPPLGGLDFYPRPPRGGRLQLFLLLCNGLDISIHALREEGDRHVMAVPVAMTYFYPRPPRGGRLVSADDSGGEIPISIHALREEGDFD